MKLTRCVTIAGGAAALFGLVVFSGPAVWAQDATPEATAAMPPRPVHIHTGNCNELGEVVHPLTDLSAPEGDQVGQRRASAAQYSYTSVPVTLDALLADNFAINAHLSAEEIGTYIACGEIGGVLGADGSLAIGLREVDNSGFAGVAFLTPGTDGASTGVSVFVTSLERNRGAGGEDEAQAADEESTEAVPAAEGTPVASTGEDTLVAGGQVPASLAEFTIDMPTDVAAGSVTFSVVNDGTIQHSFEIEGNGIEEELDTPLDPGDSGMLTVDLAPGTYEVYCPIDAHADQGMRTEITVS